MVQTAITIDSTLSGTDSNAFMSLAEVETEINARPFHADWDIITDNNVKGGAIIWATKLMTDLKWDGKLTFSTQALSFPRSGLFDFDHREYDKNALPNWFKSAFTELVFNFAIQTLLSDSDTAGLKSVKLGTISVTVDPNFRKEIMPQYIKDMVSPWLSSDYMGNTVKLGRA